MKTTLCALLLAAAATMTFPAWAAEAKKEARPAAEKSAEPAKDYTVIRVGGEDIKMSEVVEIWKGLFPGGSAPDFSSFEENIRGTLSKGKLADFVILAEDPHAVEPDHIKDIKVMRTVVGGQTVHRKDT